MELTIYNTYVVMESQEQCDRMKKLCIDNKLPIWRYVMAFSFFKNGLNIFAYKGIEFYVRFQYKLETNKTQVTEEQFIELLKSNK